MKTRHGNAVCPAGHSLLLAVAAALVPALSSFGQAANDSCATPEAISGLGTFPFTTVGATTDGPASPECLFFSQVQVWKDVWFCWTPSATGLVSVATCGTATFDTKIAVYLGCDCANLMAIGCNDDACSLQSKVGFVATAGQTYMIRVGGYGTAEATAANGAGSLVISDGAIHSAIHPDTGHQYIVINSPLWADGEAMAVLLGGHLATMNDADENAWVAANVATYGGVGHRCFIGMNDVAVEGQYEWTSGEPVTYLNWAPGEPNDSGGVEDMAELFAGGTLSGMWNDQDSNGTGAMVAIVEIGQAPPPPCLGDFDGDGFVTGGDMSMMLGAWGTSDPLADLDGDGFISGGDLAELLSRWGACP